jgi:hypothetical protein
MRRLSQKENRPGSSPGRGTNDNGSVAEWSMALVLKTSGPKGPVSSNLTASAKFKRSALWIQQNIGNGYVKTCSKD